MNDKRYGAGFVANLVGIAMVLISIGLTHLGLAQESTPETRERIGVYDSRAVAVAFAGSEFQKRKMNELLQQRNKARESGDAQKVSRLEAEGRAWQASLHRQGFGTAPVDDILAYIGDELPRIRQRAGVTTLVSKWDQQTLAKHAKAERVDITMQLVDAFHPTERQRKSAIEIQTKKPQKITK